MNIILSTIRNFFKPSFHRIILTIIAVSVYHNTYSKEGHDLWRDVIKGGIIGPLLFPSFYLSYMYIYYPENFNYKNTNPTIPTTGLITELNTVINSPINSILIFVLLYLFFTTF